MNSSKPHSALVTNSVYLIPIAIFAAKILEIFFKLLDWNFITPPDEYGNSFILNFIEWFGVLYGILLPLILVRVWEQLDDIDREFDREADAIRIMYEDLSYLTGKSIEHGGKIAELLKSYAVHVMAFYPLETKESIYEAEDIEDRSNNTNIFSKIKWRIDYAIYSAGKSLKKLVSPEVYPRVAQGKRREGDDILEKIRLQLRNLVQPEALKSKVIEFLIPELLSRLNEVIDIRGDRIAYSSQRLFGSLRVVALITSIMFVVPFYFVGFSLSSGFLDNILVVGVTILVIFIYLTIEDFDEPFNGIWRITDESWRRVVDYINANSYENLPHTIDENIPMQSKSVKKETTHRRAGQPRPR